MRNRFIFIQNEMAKNAIADSKSYPSFVEPSIGNSEVLKRS